MEKRLDGNYTRMLWAILNKSWRQHPTNQQLYGHLPLVTKIIKIRRNRHAGHCLRSRDELISDELLWTPSDGRAKAEWPARTYIQQLCEDTGCSPEELPEVMNDREGWRERVRDIRAAWQDDIYIYMFCVCICVYIFHILSGRSPLPSGICLFVSLPLLICSPVVNSTLLVCMVFLIITILLLWEFFTPTLANVLPMEFEWLRVSSSLHDASQDSGCS